ncbi:uncharacterized protein N0V89_001233 [Didymosphaeria variabile]|uniref:RNase III domain-containing protein n=1 Tax=Didymosphaeria variabile TaxID=1932322 RepID=A0A9W8XVR4_9PLEO|nr:uncharacterized protein N0V89_001233 [Didymosphaeria variabile]KAJ4360667.1 hypothetical protein N0V89_001233 [Didymosphaeria variabile]
MAAPQSLLMINGQAHQVGANKRLAVLGDAVATQVLCEVWFNDRDQNGKFAHWWFVRSVVFTNDFTGNPRTLSAWTLIRQDTLSNGSLASLGNLLGLAVTIIAAPGHEGMPGTVMMATAMEAILGAVYEDGGDAAVRHVMAHIGLNQQVVMSKYPYQHLSGLSLLTNMLLLDTGCGRPQEPP